MGADGWIRDPGQEIVVELICYICSKPIDPWCPIVGHRTCRDNEGKLPVSVEMGDNWDVR